MSIQENKASILAKILFDIEQLKEATRKQKEITSLGNSWLYRSISRINAERKAESRENSGLFSAFKSALLGVQRQLKQIEQSEQSLSESKNGIETAMKLLDMRIAEIEANFGVLRREEFPNLPVINRINKVVESTSDDENGKNGQLNGEVSIGLNSNVRKQVKFRQPAANGPINSPKYQQEMLKESPPQLSNDFGENSEKGHESVDEKLTRLETRLRTHENGCTFQGSHFNAQSVRILNAVKQMEEQKGRIEKLEQFKKTAASEFQTLLGKLSFFEVLFLFISIFYTSIYAKRDKTFKTL